MPCAFQAVCCFSCMVSSTRMFVMDTRDIVPDPCDNRIIRFNNCIQLLSCICTCLSICFSELDYLAYVLDIISDITFCCTVSCMTAQTAVELNYWEEEKMQVVDWNRGDGVPHYMKMNRGKEATPAGATGASV